MNKALLIILACFLGFAYLIVLIVRAMLELVKRVTDATCGYFDEVLEGVEAPYLETRKKLSDSK